MLRLFNDVYAHTKTMDGMIRDIDQYMGMDGLCFCNKMLMLLVICNDFTVIKSLHQI